MVAKVEELKVQLQAQEAQSKMELERYKVELQDARERDKAAREFALKEYEIELKYQSEIDDRKLQAKIAQAKTTG